MYCIIIISIHIPNPYLHFGLHCFFQYLYFPFHCVRYLFHCSLVIVCIVIVGILTITITIIIRCIGRGIRNAIGYHGVGIATSVELDLLPSPVWRLLRLLLLRLKEQLMDELGCWRRSGSMLTILVIVVGPASACSKGGRGIIIPFKDGAVIFVQLVIIVIHCFG